MACVYYERYIYIEKKTHLLDFPFIALVCSGNVVCEGLRTGKVMVAAGRGDNVALACNLAGETGHWTGDLVDFAEEENTREAAGNNKSQPVLLQGWYENGSGEQGVVVVAMVVILTRLDTEEWWDERERFSWNFRRH